MFLKDIVEQISQQAGVRLGVGVLVEYPLSRPRQKVFGTLLGKWAGKHTAPYNVRKASVVLLVEGHQHRTTTVFSAVPICWKSWQRARFANSSLDGCEFVRQDEQIQICELQDDGQYTGGQISDFYVLDLSGQISDVFDLMAYAKALRESLINCCYEVEDLKFLATCDDLEWLAVCYPKYVPKPLNERVMEVQKDEAEAETDAIKNDIKYIKSKLRNRQNDLLEAKDRFQTRWRPLRKFLGLPGISIIWSVVKLTLAFVVAGFVFGISDFFGNSVNSGLYVSSGLSALIVITYKVIRYFRKISQRTDKFFANHRRIEESRERRTEEYFNNP